MSFLVKGVVKKILEQYLNIKDQIDLEKGSIVLAEGHLNHHKLNHKFKSLNIQVAQSEYKNLSLWIPIIDIMTKPIFLKVEKLQVVLIKTQNQPDQSPTTPTRDSGSEGYLKVIANKLLMNIEVQIQRMELTIKRPDAEVICQGHISRLKIKNSVSFLNVNLLRKIVYLGQFAFKSLDGSAKVNDLNLCLNLDDHKVGLLMLVDVVQATIKQSRLLALIKPKQKSSSSSTKFVLEQLQIKINKLQFVLESQQTIRCKGKSIQFCVKKDQLLVGGEGLSLTNSNHTIIKIQAQTDEQNQSTTKQKLFTINVHETISVRNIGVVFNVQQIFHCLHKYKQVLPPLQQKQQKQQKQEKKHIIIYNAVLHPLFPQLKLCIHVDLQLKIGKNIEQLNIEKILVESNGFDAICLESLMLKELKQQLILSIKNINICLEPRTLKQVLSIIQNDKAIKQLTKKKQKKQTKIIPIYYKLSKLKVQVGVLDLKNRYLSILEMSCLETKGKLKKNKLTLKTQIQYIMSISPHNLSTSTIAKGVRFTLDQNKQSTSLTLLDSLNIDLSQETIRLMLCLLKDKSLLLEVRNQTDEEIAVEQNIPTLPSFFTFDQNISIKPHQKQNIFIVDDPSSIVIGIKGQKSRVLPLSYSREPTQLNINFSYHEQPQHVLQMCENIITVKYKYELIVYDQIKTNRITKLQIINTNNDNEQLKLVKSVKFTWELLQVDKVGYLKLFIKEKQNNQYRVCRLMANHESYRIYGVYRKEQPKYYNFYILQDQKMFMSRYLLMPFIIIRNNLNRTIRLKISCKKTQQTQMLELGAGEQYDGNGSKFDFYMKQFIFQITLGDTFSSDEHYFNTFFMVDEQFQTLIELRNQMKKQYIAISQLFLHKTKVFEFGQPLLIVNELNHHITLKNMYQIPPNSSQSLTHKLTKDLVFVFENQQQISVPIKQLFQSTLILSFNFCKVNSSYYNVLVKLTLTTSHCHQTLKLQPFIIFHNLCPHPLSIHEHILPPQHHSTLLLPSNTNHHFNNKYLKANIEVIYEELFNEKHNQILFNEGIDIEICGQKLKLSELVSAKLIESEKRIIYCLLKNVKDERIQFYLSDKLYNSVSLSYFLLNNETNHNFLMSSDTHYAQIIFQQPTHTHETIFIQENSFNSMLNKDKYDMFLCNHEQKNLHPLTIHKLEKLHTKMERYVMDNFTLVNLENDIRYEEPLLQINTKRIVIRLQTKQSLRVDLKFLNVRLLQPTKIDILLRDISCYLDEQVQILRIADESYILVEGKTIVDKFILLKNVFLKCKLIDIHLTKQFLQTCLHFNRFLQQLQDSRETTPQSKEKKILNYMQEKIILIKGIHLHSMNLCLSTDINNMDFSNMIVLPEFQLSSRSYRWKNLSKDITNHYLTNILAKFPKLSFIFQNLRNPLATIKSLLEARQLLKQEKHPLNFILLKDNWNHINRLNNLLNKNRYIKYKLRLKNSQQKDQIILYNIKNAIFNSIPNLGVTNYYYLTNMNMYVIGYEERTAKFSCKTLPLKSMTEAKIMKYNKKDGELIIQFKNKQGHIKIVDKVSMCQSILSTIQQVLI